MKDHLKPSKLSTLVASRQPQSRDMLRRKIQQGYECSYEQAEALLKIGLMNNFITYDKLTDQYRINDEKTHG